MRVFARLGRFRHGSSIAAVFIGLVVIEKVVQPLGKSFFTHRYYWVF
jgi:hypothetical protein